MKSILMGVIVGLVFIGAGHADDYVGSSTSYGSANGKGSFSMRMKVNGNSRVTVRENGLTHDHTVNGKESSQAKGSGAFSFSFSGDGNGRSDSQWLGSNYNRQYYYK